MGIFEHLAELRYRLLIVALAVTAAAIASYFIVDRILEVLFAPFFNSFSKGMLIGTGPAEAFILKLKVSFFSGVLIACPVIFIQIWFFISPGLYDNEKKMVFPFVICTSALFLAGVLFCFHGVLPLAFDFFRSEYESIGKVTPAIRVDEHLSLVIKGLLGFGVVFEMPVLAFFLGRVGVINDKMMISYARYVIVLIFIISAILTPPDVLTQFLMAIPLMVLYGLSILIVRYTQKPRAEETT